MDKKDEVADYKHIIDGKIVYMTEKESFEYVKQAERAAVKEYLATWVELALAPKTFLESIKSTMKKKEDSL